MSKLWVRAAATGLDATRGSRRDGAALGNYGSIINFRWWDIRFNWFHE